MDLPIELQIPELDVGELRQGRLPLETQQAIDQADAILFGAASSTALPILLYLRWGLKTYANVRPVRHIPGAQSPLKDPERIDYVIVRENLEGLYPGREGDLALLRERLPQLSDLTGQRLKDIGDGKFAVCVITEERTKKLAEFAVELALERKRHGHEGRISCLTKSNMLRQSDGLFQTVVESVVKGHRALAYDHFLVDDGARRLVQSPEQFDVIITSNLYGDILSDVGAATIGGLGLAPSGCYGEGKAYFEPVHGTAPDLAGQQRINPTATLLSAVLMLEYLRLGTHAAQLEEAVRTVYREGRVRPVDQGGRASTTEFCRAVRRLLRPPSPHRYNKPQ
jgi:3-isopropylmalate dehydrogenase